MKEKVVTVSSHLLYEMAFHSELVEGTMSLFWKGKINSEELIYLFTIGCFYSRGRGMNNEQISKDVLRPLAYTKKVLGRLKAKGLIRFEYRKRSRGIIICYMEEQMEMGRNM